MKLFQVYLHVFEKTKQKTLMRGKQCYFDLILSTVNNTFPKESPILNNPN